MDKKYIDAEAVKTKKVYCEERHEYVIPVAEIDWDPAADVEPVRHGRWKYYRKRGFAVCTECSFERKLDADFGRAIACPNCGAKMDVEET